MLASGRAIHCQILATTDATAADFVNRDEDKASECEDEEGIGGQAVQLLAWSVDVFANIANEQRESHKDEREVRAEDLERGFAKSEKRLNGDHAKKTLA